MTLKADSIAVGFDKVTVLNNASLELSAAQIIAIGGPNGVGKSTLIKTMARQLKPISGTVTVNGADIWSVSPSEFARQLAYVPQNFDGNLELTVEEMVSLGRNPHQQWWQWQSSSHDREAVEKALAASGLSKLKSKSLSQLSGGEKQRAAVATALAQEPKYLLLDEPTANLDFKHQLDLLAMLRELREQGLGIMLVLHDLNMMAKVADRVILLERVSEDSAGQIAVDGTAESTLTQENLRRIFEIDVHPFKDPNTGETYFNPFVGAG